MKRCCGCVVSEWWRDWIKEAEAGIVRWRWWRWVTSILNVITAVMLMMYTVNYWHTHTHVHWVLFMNMLFIV